MKIRIGRLLIAAVLMIGLLTVAVYAGPAIAPTQDNTPPVAAFSVDPTSGVVGRTSSSILPPPTITRILSPGC